MIRQLGLWLAVAALWPINAVAQPDGKQPVIVVVGNGTASKPPDYATFRYSVRGEGKTEVLALQALSDTRDRIEGRLAKLAKASRIDIEPSDLSVAAARAGECHGEDSDDGPASLSTGPCAITGYVVTMKVAVDIEPADRVGDAISLASESGATDASFSNWRVHDMASLHGAAVHDAIENARREADAIAASSAMKLGAILRIEDQNDRSSDIVVVDDLSNISPGLSYTHPSVPISMKPQPVQASANYRLTYSIAP